MPNKSPDDRIDPAKARFIEHTCRHPDGDGETQVGSKEELLAGIARLSNRKMRLLVRVLAERPALFR